MRRAAACCAAILLAGARMASADCAPDRPATAAEKKIYADGLALFKQMAPVAPTGWVVRDSPTDATLNRVCTDPGQAVTRWGYNRSFERTEGVEQRRADALKLTQAAVQRWQKNQQVNQARLAAIQKQMTGNMQRMQALIAARKYPETEKITAENEKLDKELTALMNTASFDAELQSIDAAANRDIQASFSLTIGERSRNTDAFKPMPATVGRGYRQDYASKGIRHTDLMVIVGGAGGYGNQTVVMISGDPARADALLKATKLQLLPR